MYLSLDDFCAIVKGLGKSNAEKAMAVLWYHDRKQPETSMTPGQLTKILIDHHIGTPNTTQLAGAIKATKLANEAKGALSLKPGSRRIIYEWLPKNINGMQPQMDHSAGYLPERIWSGTRGYVESVCKQLNGCFRSAYYDAALVMMRRLMETLIIEVYESLNRASEIKDNGGTGNYYMLNDLVERATGKNKHVGLNIGRNTKNALEEVKKLGDRSAHDRRFNACAADLEKIQIDVRSGTQDLMQLAWPSRP
jgi:hypothetical protein